MCRASSFQPYTRNRWTKVGPVSGTVKRLAGTSRVSGSGLVRGSADGAGRRLVPWAAHRGVGETLAELDARLIEGVNAVPGSRIAGGELEEHDRLPQRRGAEVRQTQRAAHPPHLRQRCRRRLVFGAQQLAQRVAWQVRQV